MSRDNQRLAAIGENMVVVRLLQEGMDAINANNIHTNFAKVDVICPTDTGFIQVQVKTSDEKNPNFPTGLSIEKAQNRSIIEKSVLGPWVFVHVKGEGRHMSFDYYVLSRDEIIELIYESNRWYVEDYSRTADIKKTSLVGVKLSLIQGSGEAKTARHKAFISPIRPETAKDAWDKITKL